MSGLSDSNWLDPGYYRGVALAEAGRCSEAVSEFDRVARLHVLWGLDAVLAPQASLEAASCLEKLHRPVEARERLDRLLALWSRADPDLPALAEAKALCRKVGCRLPGARPSGGDRP